MAITKIVDDVRTTTVLDAAKVTTGTIPEARITSLDSTKFKSLIFHPAFFKANFEVGIGPVPIKAGSTPHCAQDTILARGTNLFLLAVLMFCTGL